MGWKYLVKSHIGFRENGDKTERKDDNKMFIFDPHRINVSLLKGSPNDDAVSFNHRKDSGLKYHPKELRLNVNKNHGLSKKVADTVKNRFSLFFACG